MGSVNGKSNNPKGRPLGSRNKSTAEIQNWVQKLISSNLKQIQKDMKSLEPKERLKIFEKLLNYVLPRKSSVSTQIDFSQLTDEQLDELINRITKYEEE